MDFASGSENSQSPKEGQGQSAGEALKGAKCDSVRGPRPTVPSKDNSDVSDFDLSFNEDEIDVHDRSTSLGQYKPLPSSSTISLTSGHAFSCAGPSRLAMGKGKGKAGPEEAIAKVAVGDKLMDEYPDRNPGEKHFPNIGNSKLGPAVISYYDALRESLFTYLHGDQDGYVFRSGCFKEMATPGISVQALLLNMSLSNQVTREEFQVLFNFGRVWAKAIGASKDFEVLDRDFIIGEGLEYFTEELMEMFTNDKTRPLPYPLPECVVYKSPAQLRRKLDYVCGIQDEREAATLAGADESIKAARKAAASTKHVRRSLCSAIFSCFSAKPHELLTLGITKKLILEKLEEYSAATSSDQVLRGAWIEISAIKGELTNKSIDKLSADTIGLIHNYIQNEADAKSLEMPLGSALNATVARLDALQAQQQSSGAPSSELHDAPMNDTSKAKGKSSKKNKKSKEKGKGKERDPDM